MNHEDDIDRALERHCRMGIRMTNATIGDAPLLLRPFLIGPVLYYPGAGLDWGPLLKFRRHAGVEAFVYADYTRSRQEVEGGLAAIPGYAIARLDRLEPVDLGACAWADLWHPEALAGHHGNPETAFAFYAVLYSEAARQSATMLYLGTEAVQTYGFLWGERPQRPDVVVLQDHGWGGGWSHFGADHHLYRLASLNPPPFLYVGEGTESWPGYRQVSPFAGNEGEHGIPRAVFVHEKPFNKKGSRT